MENEKQGVELKHLAFVRAAVVTTLAWLSNLYDYAKENSGSLNNAVVAVESAVTASVAPLYRKFESVAPQILSFLDQKIDEMTVKFDENAPPIAKRAAGLVHSIVKTTTQTTHELLHRAQIGGPSAAARYAASESKELLLTGSVQVWRKLEGIPPLHAMVDVAVPTVAHWSDRYNRTVTNMSRKGYAVFSYLPLVPVDEIAKAFKQAESNSPVKEVVAE